MLWLLAAGIGDVSGARLRKGIAAAEIIESEIETMKKHLQRHGQQAMWVVAAPTEKSDLIMLAHDGNPVRMRKVKNKRRSLTRG